MPSAGPITIRRIGALMIRIPVGCPSSSAGPRIMVLLRMAAHQHAGTRGGSRRRSLAPPCAGGGTHILHSGSCRSPRDSPRHRHSQPLHNLLHSLCHSSLKVIRVIRLRSKSGLLCNHVGRKSAGRGHMCTLGWYGPRAMDWRLCHTTFIIDVNHVALVHAGRKQIV